MKYIKLFQTIADKQAATLDYPNTNYVVENSKASIEREAPIDQEHIVAKYNVTDTSSATRILYDKRDITYMIVDGVQQPSVTTGYTFSTTGTHTVKYKVNSNWNGGNGGPAFRECSHLVSITIPDSVTSIGNNAFQNCSGLTSVYIPSGATSIGQNAFTGCTSLTSVTIPDSVTSIGRWAFASSGLLSIEIPSGVTNISLYTFLGCTSLTSVTIPDNVTSIEDGAFLGCSGLTSVTVEATTPPTLGSSVFNNTNNCPIYVPSASVNAYKTAASGWSTYASRIQAIQ